MDPYSGDIDFIVANAEENRGYGHEVQQQNLT